MIGEGISELWKSLSYFIMVIFFILAVATAFLSIAEQSEESIALGKAGASLAYAVARWEDSPGCINSSKVSSADLPENSSASIYRIDGALVSQVSRGSTINPVTLKVPVVVDGEEGYIIFEVSRE